MMKGIVTGTVVRNKETGEQFVVNHTKGLHVFLKEHCECTECTCEETPVVKMAVRRFIKYFGA